MQWQSVILEKLDKRRREERRRRPPCRRDDDGSRRRGHRLEEHLGQLPWTRLWTHHRNRPRLGRLAPFGARKGGRGCAYLEVGWTEKEMRREAKCADASGADERRKDESH